MRALPRGHRPNSQRPDWLAGAPGFEPGNGGIKIRCLTTWLRPIATRVGVLRRTGAPGARTIAGRPRPINAAFAWHGRFLWSFSPSLGPGRLAAGRRCRTRREMTYRAPVSDIA